MRWPVLVILALVLIGCGGPKGLSRSARLDHGHYQFGVAKRDTGGSREYHPQKRRTEADDQPATQAIMTAVECSSDPAPLASASWPGLAASGISPSSTPDFFAEPELDRSEHRANPHNEEPPGRTQWNPFALAAPLLFILALVIAIPLESTELLLIGCAIAFVAALIGARQCRDRGQRGQGFALAVIGFSVALVLIATIALLSRLGN